MLLPDKLPIGTDPGGIDRVVPRRHEQASVMGADIAAQVLLGAVIGAAVADGPGGEIAFHAPKLARAIAWRIRSARQ